MEYHSDGRLKDHIVQLCFAPELRMLIIHFQSKMGLSEKYAALFLLTKALYQEQLLSREEYERFTKRYSSKLVHEAQPAKLTASQSREQQKLEEKRRWFERIKAEFHKDHRPLASGKSWREDVLAEAEKYKDQLPVAAEILRLAIRQ